MTPDPVRARRRPMARPGSRLRSRRLGLFAALALALVVAAPALAVRLNFELDGNIAAGGMIGRDWSSVLEADANGYGKVKAGPLVDPFVAAGFNRDFRTYSGGSFNPADYTTFTLASKDTRNISSWYCVPANNVNNKTDIANAYAALLVGDDDEDRLYFGLEKDTENGDNNVGIWFVQDARTGCSSSYGSRQFRGTHRTGDLFITSAFTRGGGVSTIRAYQWTAGGTLALIASAKDCSASVAGGANPDLCAIVNTSTLTTPWKSVQNSAVRTTKAAATFFEGGINLDAFPAFADRCYNKAVFNTRSSQSLTATLFDFATVTINTCPPLSVTNTVETSLTRTYDWDIEKTATPAAAHLFDGQATDFDYEVEVTKDAGTDSDWHIDGTVRIANTYTSPLEVATVVVEIEGLGEVEVDCPVNLEIPAGGYIECTYETDAPNGTTRTSTATVTQVTENEDVDEAEADFGAADVTTVNDEVTVTDTLEGTLGTIDDDETFEYTGATQDCTGISYTAGAGYRDITNTATWESTDTAAEGSDSATVRVNCYRLSVSTTANTAYDRDYDWTIAKSVDDDDLLLTQDQEYESEYTVVLTRGAAEDSNETVSGNIVVTNPAPIAATLDEVTGELTGSIASDVTCAALTVPAKAGGTNGSLTCTYTADVPDTTSRTHTATAVQDLGGTFGTKSYTGTATATFGAADSVTDECVTLEDTLEGEYPYAGEDTSLCATTTWTYTRPVDTSVCGDFEIDNTASYASTTLVGGLPNETGEDSVTVTVTITCDEGCTLTQGYWRTHSAYGPAPRDETWDLLHGWYWQAAVEAVEVEGLVVTPAVAAGWYQTEGASLGPDEPFFQKAGGTFSSTLTWYQAIWTPTKGNSYWQLARQYQAAVLNRLTGASAPAAVLDAIEDAEGLFQTYGPYATQWTAKNSATRSQAITLAGILGSYNEGSIGPGHCDEDANSLFLP